MNLYDRIAPFYAVDMALNMPFDDVGFWSRACAARGQRVLELGCGSGRITAGLLAAGLQVCAVDRSAPMLAELRRQLGRDTVLVQYLVGERGGWVWSLSHDRLVAAPLPQRAELDRLVRSVTDAWSRRAFE